MKRAPASLYWRHCALAGVALGLAVAPMLGAVPGGASLVPVIGLSALALALARPRDPRPRDQGPPMGRFAPWLWLGLVACLAASAGSIAGLARLAAIDGGAARGPVDGPASATGYVVAPPRSADGELRVEVKTAHGRLLVRAPDRGTELGVGEEVRVSGRLVEPEPWLAGWLRRRGIALILDAPMIEPTGAARGGVAGRIDAIRRRAERALERGMPERESALGRGFVLGQDDRIDGRTTDDFKRSGLAHLLR